MLDGAEKRRASLDQNSTDGNRLINPAAGLAYLPSLLSINQQRLAVENVDASVDQWRHDLSGRTQHYGWRYDYRAKAITPDLWLGQLPDWLQEIAQSIFENAVHPTSGLPRFDHMPEQCIVNEYVGSPGIAEHTDHPGCGPAIATVSLLADAPRPRLPTAQPARRSRDWLLPHDDGPQPTGLDTSDQMRPSPPTQRTPAFAYVPQRPQPGRRQRLTNAANPPTDERGIKKARGRNTGGIHHHHQRRLRVRRALG